MSDSSQRFIRNYELTITTSTQQIIIKPPLRISFTGTKASEGGMNKLELSIYNLKKETALALFKDRNQSKLIDMELKVGYINYDLKSFYSGTIHYASTDRQQADLVTKIEGIDGGFDVINGDPINANITGKQNIINHVVSNSTKLQIGKISLADNLTRPKMCMGSSYDVLHSLKDSNTDFFIDNENIYFLLKNQVISSFIPKINSASGLLSTPQKQSNVVTFTSLMNTDIRLAGLVELQSTVNTNLNGIYKISKINYSGDYRGQDWKMQVEAFLNADYEVV